MNEAKQISLATDRIQLNSHPDRDKPRRPFTQKASAFWDDTAPNRGFACQETAPGRMAQKVMKQ